MATQPRFVVTVDDPGGLIQDLAIFDRARRFFDREGVPVSFYVVPRGEGGWLLDEQTDWLAALHSAERDGHDCQLHGLDHHGCEFGPYPPLVMEMGGPDIEAHLRADTERFGHLWRQDLYEDKLTTAIAIFQRAFGRRPLSLRTGALSQTPELYSAMATVGLRYASNAVTDPRGWKYICELYDEPGDWDPAVPPGPYQLTSAVINLPIISEYAWYLTEEKIPKHLALAVEDVGRVYQVGGVFLLVCHVQCVGAEDGLSQKLLSQLFAIARREHDPLFENVAELVRDLEAGQVGLLAGGG
ncbi:MAG: DUF2334 domain-containing protein [Armatimonadetes bacterium]|nr:DUF2334 domain-containing protein [Armatimonadota bacterium]